MTSMFALLTGTLVALGGPGPVTQVAITPQAGETSVLISVSGNPAYRHFTMEGPNRLVVDLMDAREALPQHEYTDVNRGGILSIRSSQLTSNIVRVVFTLQKMVSYGITRDPRGLRITLPDPGGEMFAPWSSGARSNTPPPAPAAPRVAARDETRVAQQTAFNDFTPSTDPQVSHARHISITFTNSPIQDVLLAFSQFSGKSIVPGEGIASAGLVTADIHDQPWDVAMNQILAGHGLVAHEDNYGIIRVDNIQNLNQREKIEPIYTEAYRINYTTASELQTEIRPLLTTRGKVTVGAGTNTLIVSDIRRVQSEVTELLKQLDQRPQEVAIQTKIIYVDRTKLSEMGVSYELKDLSGNQYNELSGGETVQNGTVTPVPQGTSVVELGGNSVAAIGNAFSRVNQPTLSLLSSLVIGRFQLVNFLDALASANLSDVQASPQITTVDNVQASILVGQIIPVRVISAGTGSSSTGAFPTAQVTTEQTGIIVNATPHVTATGDILMDISAQRSSAVPATSDAGFIKQTQQGTTRVLVKDGQTAMIAGLSQNQRTEVTSGIPLLMDLPVLGRLFRHKQTNVEQQDLIILVTPHIVKTSD